MCSDQAAEVSVVIYLSFLLVDLKALIKGHSLLRNHFVIASGSNEPTTPAQYSSTAQFSTWNIAVGVKTTVVPKSVSEYADRSYEGEKASSGSERVKGPAYLKRRHQDASSFESWSASFKYIMYYSGQLRPAIWSIVVLWAGGVGKYLRDRMS